jgi:antitoxin component HigA of HigAB toxin-antitoxin module
LRYWFRIVEIGKFGDFNALKAAFGSVDYVAPFDLAEDFGSQSNVSEVLSGKREINARQARSLAARFGVSSAVFI